MTSTMIGTVRTIHTAPEAGASMQSHECVEAVVGRGLRGDRYFRNTGTYSDSARDISREITLIESEALEAVQRDYDIDIDVDRGEHRRNVTTDGIAFNHFVGEQFQVGDVICKGAELCTPCSYLEQLLEKEGVHDALIHRGGLRARIIEGGTINVGDRVRAPAASDDHTDDSLRTTIETQR
jgi:hypothetical protein